uniref:TRF2/HOY1 PH-like domain-containing protein n=1 Tax=Oryza meridionalis TaxID=40149 RepID=A0A0E0DY36_9ORYZ
MVQLPSSGKRPAEPAMAAASAAGATVKLEADEMLHGGEEDGGPLSKRAKAGVQMPAPPPPQQQDMYHNVLDEPSPLGLRLRKSPSLLDLIQMRLSQANSSAGQSSADDCSSEPPKKKDLKSGTSTSGERLKASNFPANILRIGTWEYISRYEGDLVAKCYFAKHKLVWEVLEGGLKSKIEIQWSDITALKASCPENGQGTLDVVLARPPLFFKETDPQPRKHTLWQATSDFTGGQASMNRRHFLQCPSSLLSKNFEKLLQCDQRLNQLSQQPDIILDSPVFEPRCSIFEDPVESKCQGFTNLKDEHELSGFSGSLSPCSGSSMSAKIEVNDSIATQAGFLAQPGNPGPSAVNVQGVSRNVNGAPELNIPSWWSQLKVPGLRPSMSVDDLVNHLGNCISEQITSVNPTLPSNEVPTKETLEEIAQYLLGDAQGPPTSTSDERSLMARVDSLCCLIQKDTPPVAQPKPEPNDSDSIGGDGTEGSDEEFSSAASTVKTAGPAQPPAMSRKDSFGDLLMNLPRIASLPQFLFKIPEDSEN